MAHGDIVASNDLLEERAQKLLERFESGCSLRLFSNNLQPSPANRIGDFNEATFAGYGRKNMAGQWSIVRKQEDGRYTFVSTNQIFTGAVDAIGFVYGWFLVIGGKVQFSARLPVAWTAAIGKQVQVKISLQTAAASLGCCVKCGG
jgi:hypothetical protein